MIKQWWVYMVECGDKTLYTGCTNDLLARIKSHNSGNGAKYTKSRLPVTLVFCEKQASRSLALKREWQIKQKNKQQKVELIQTFSPYANKI